jgi:hypothetical protein
LNNFRKEILEPSISLSFVRLIIREPIRYRDKLKLVGILSLSLLERVWGEGLSYAASYTLIPRASSKTEKRESTDSEANQRR